MNEYIKIHPELKKKLKNCFTDCIIIKKDKIIIKAEIPKDFPKYIIKSSGK